MRRHPPAHQLQPDLPLIHHHHALPPGVVELAHIHDFSIEGRTWSFLRYQHKLILLMHYRQQSGGDTQYGYFQREFPLEFLRWFPSALAQYEQNPSLAIEGTLGAEQLSLHASDVGRGYCAVLNYSRCQRGHSPITDFRPQETIIANHFIYQGGLLALIKQLGQQYLPAQPL
ncbi:MAG TPA: hypothetical protein PKE57_00200 [Cellvibrionaceae bacterium]|nr:hypothetical protein [Cellvibrionaceae bacterium]HMW46913.1 hypothetical protein [Cellvibrionaceae bacterium]HMW70821.1 hypothetical protein [Cellvibrionaceae bacterium]HMY37830.1 hypothetical protein [Marinagarivorans sp.]HNG59462.1 hypothetical protein [Cellvibrionaceae bacterium]